MSQFDPKAFLDMTYNEANDTKRIPVPAGEHVAIITKVDTRTWQGREDPSKSGIALDVTYEIDSPQVKEALGRDKVTVTQGIMLDLTAEGMLDNGKGKNVDLGKLREATGLNVAGQPFGFRMLEGKVVKVLVVHDPSTKNPGEVFSNVRAVTKA